MASWLGPHGGRRSQGSRTIHPRASLLFLGPFYHLQTPPRKGGGAESFDRLSVDHPYGAGLASPSPIGQVRGRGSP